MSTGHWSHGLCSCCDDPIVCSIAFCVNCGPLLLHLWSSARASHNNSCVMPCCLWFWLCDIGHAINRTQIRAKLGIKGSCFTDCCIWMWCGPCAAQQEYREMRDHINANSQLKGNY